MSRSLIAIVVLVLGLAALSLPVLFGSGDAAQQGLTGDIRRGLLELSDSGGGFADGALVWQEREPYRVTLEELPSLEGRLRGTDYDKDLISEELAWYGLSLRRCLAKCLHRPPAWVLGDERLDSIWLDVNAARTAGFFAPEGRSWEDVEERILTGLLTAYDLSVRSERQTLQVVVLKPGPGWAGHVLAEPRSSTRVIKGDGRLELSSAPASHLLEVAAGLLRVDLAEGLDGTTLCDLSLRWLPDDPVSFEQVLAGELDLHLVREQREVDVIVVDGVPDSRAATAPSAASSG